MSTNEEGTKKPPVAEQLIVLAHANYEFVRTTDDEYYAIPIHGAKVAKPLSGGRSSFMSDIAKRYRDATRGIAPERALKDAIRVLEGEISDTDPILAHTRIASHSGKTYIDRGDSTGECVEISGEGWKVLDIPPVLFRRSSLTGPIRRPEHGGNVYDIFKYINIPKSHWHLFLGFLVVSLIENVAHPILAINGEHGAAKSGATDYTTKLIDPSPVTTRTPPTDSNAWVTAALGSWVVGIDNITKIHTWFSDSLCRASTGDGDTRRKLYTDNELVVFRFRRVVILNGINLAEAREDLADRLLPIMLPIITDTSRKVESEMKEEWEENYPMYLGALYTLCSKVLAKLPETKLAKLPRMADFALVLAALDSIEGSDSLGQYLEEINNRAASSIENNTFFKILTIQLNGKWTGTSNELKNLITPHPYWPEDKNWPHTAKAVTGLLMRFAPTLRKIGWTVQDLGSNNKSGIKQWLLAPPEADGEAGVAGMNSQLSYKKIEEESVESVESTDSTPATPASFGLGGGFNDPLIIPKSRIDRGAWKNY